METRNKKKFQLPKADRIVLIILTIATVVLAVFTTLERAGYRLMATETTLIGMVVLLVGFVTWGLSAIARRFKSKYGRIVAIFCVGAIVLIIGSLLLAYISQFARIMLPSKYSVITNEAGRKAVVMMRVDTGFESEEAYLAATARMDARREQILAEDPSVVVTEEDPYPTGAYGFSYNIYPVVGGIFFNEKADAEGTVYRGHSSEAKLLYEWLDDDTLRLYLENPEIGDEGESILRY